MPHVKYVHVLNKEGATTFDSNKALWTQRRIASRDLEARKHCDKMTVRTVCCLTGCVHGMHFTPFCKKKKCPRGSSHIAL